MGLKLTNLSTEPLLARNRNDGDGAVEKADDVEESARDVLGNDDGAVVVLGVPPSLNIPVLDSPDDVALVGSPQLQLNFISAIAVGILQQKVEPTCVRLPPLIVFEHQVSEPENPRVIRHQRLDPSLVEFGMVL